MATLITSKPSTMNFPSSLNRMGTFPIDLSSVWYSYDDAVAYATQTNFKPTYKDQTGLPYVGQILTVVETAKDGTTSVTAYSIQNEAGDLAQVGTVTLGDNATIVRDEETGALSLYGIDELTWKETVKDAEGNETEKDVTTYQPKLVKKDGKVVLTWEIPSTITVEGLSTRIQTAEENIEQLGKDIDAVEKDLADNYYDKKEIDAKITSVLKFQGVKTYKDELPATGQVVGDVWLIIYDGNTPAEGETNTLPVANIEYVWTTENKWEPLGDDIIDLTNYYTKAEVNAQLATKGAVDKIEDGINDWTIKVTDAEGNVTHVKAKTVNASNDGFGLVKGDGTNVSIADGLITVHEAGHADEADEAGHADTADYATEAGKVTNALKIKINNETTYSFDGSVADVTVPLDNYYTKSEADNNFMTETETNDAITAVTDPLAEAIEAIKGDIPEEEGYVLPNLVNVGARLDAHDEAIEELGKQVETANSTANAANTTAGQAKTIAENAAAIAGDAKLQSDTAMSDAGAAKSQAETAVATANEAVLTSNAASGVASEAKTKAEEAVGTANTAKNTADTANAQATANKSAIEALQAEDTTIKGLVKANTSNITTLTNTVEAGLADRYTIAQTNTYVAEQIAAIDHLKREVVESLPGTPDANTIYMVPNAEILDKSFSGTTEEGIPSEHYIDMLNLFSMKSTFTIVYDGVKYTKVKAEQFASVENEGYSGYLATFGEHSLRYELGSFTFDTADSTSYTITWGDYPEDNYYVEWMYINNKWERIGTTTADLVNYLTKDGAIDNTTVGGVKTAEVVANAAKTAEWTQVSGKPTGNFVNKVELTIPAGETVLNHDVSDLDNKLVSYKAYIVNNVSFIWEEVMIEYNFNPVYESRHTFKIASAISEDIKIIAYFA